MHGDGSNLLAQPALPSWLQRCRWSHPALSCRLANVASAAEIPLQGVTYQYWFNGPDGVAAFNTSKPSDLFELQCADTTTGNFFLFKYQK